MRSFLIGFLRQPFVYGLVLLGVIFVILRFTAPTRPSIEFEPAAESAQPSAAETPVLADRLCPRSYPRPLSRLAGPAHHHRFGGRFRVVRSRVPRRVSFRCRGRQSVGSRVRLVRAGFHARCARHSRFRARSRGERGSCRQCCGAACARCSTLAHRFALHVGAPARLCSAARPRVLSGRYRFRSSFRCF